MLTTPFFEFSNSSLYELSRPNSLGCVLSVRTMLLRSRGIQPVFYPDYYLRKILDDGMDCSRNSIKNKERGWASPYLNPLLAVSGDRLKEMGVNENELFSSAPIDPRHGGANWYYTPDTGLVVGPRLMYDRESTYFQMEEGVQLQVEESHGWSMGSYGGSPDISERVWTLPWCLGWEDKENRIVSWFDTTADAIIGKRIRAKLGKFLGRYGLDSFWIEKLMDRLAERGAGDSRLGFAITADDIELVYKHGPGSCMSYDKFRGKMNQWKDGNKYNPVRAYAYPLDRTGIVEGSGNTLAVAYLGDLKSGNIKARAVVDMEKKQYSRSYGVPYFEQLLADAGYRRTDTNIEGQRLSLITLPTNEVCFPYLDFNACQGVIIGDHIRLIRSSQWENVGYLRKEAGDTVSRLARSANGWQIPDVMYFCAECGAAHSTRDGGEKIRHPDDARICSNCASRKYVTALVGFGEDGTLITKYAKQEVVTYVHPHYVLNDSVAVVTCACDKCSQVTLKSRAQTTDDGRHLCRKCWSNEDIANKFRPMYYWDPENHQIGVSNFRKTDGFTVVGFDLPVHIVSLPALCERVPCEHCGSFLRRDWACQCQIPPSERHDPDDDPEPIMDINIHDIIEEEEEEEQW